MKITAEEYEVIIKKSASDEIRFLVSWNIEDFSGKKYPKDYLEKLLEDQEDEIVIEFRLRCDIKDMIWYPNKIRQERENEDNE